jgi:hypothetical protein
VKGTFRQWNVTVSIAFATTDVEEHTFGVNVPDLEAQTFPQAQAAGVDGGQADPVIQCRDLSQDPADLASGENDRELKLRLGPNQTQFGGPNTIEALFPEEFEGANDLGAGLASDLLLGFETDAILTKFLWGNEIRRFAMEIGQLADTGVVGLLSTETDGQEGQIIGKRI